MVKINYVYDIEDIFFEFIHFVGEDNVHGGYYNDLEKQIVKKYDNVDIKSNNRNIERAFYIMKYNIKNEYIYEMDTWNICLTRNNFMFGYPFTLGDVIFMPLSHLNKKTIVRTYIHEKIHISQRFYKKMWDRYIYKYTNWRKMDVMYKQGVYNPDTYYQPYCYVKGGKKYYMVLNKDFKIEVYNMDTGKKINMVMDYEHPYELFAYKLSECIRI